jgi:hypothetical protein
MKWFLLRINIVAGLETGGWQASVGGAEVKTLRLETEETSRHDRDSNSKPAIAFGPI